MSRLPGVRPAPCPTRRRPGRGRCTTRRGSSRRRRRCAPRMYAASSAALASCTAGGASLARRVPAVAAPAAVEERVGAGRRGRRDRHGVVAAGLHRPDRGQDGAELGRDGRRPRELRAVDRRRSGVATAVVAGVDRRVAGGADQNGRDAPGRAPTRDLNGAPGWQPEPGRPARRSQSAPSGVAHVARRGHGRDRRRQPRPSSPPLTVVGDGRVGLAPRRPGSPTVPTAQFTARWACLKLQYGLTA